MDTPSPIRPPSFDEPVSEQDKTTFAAHGVGDKNIRRPAHAAARIILMIIGLLLVLGLVAGGYLAVKKFHPSFSVESVYRSLYSAPMMDDSEPTPSASVEPTLTPGNTTSEIEADLRAASIPSVEQETATIKAEVDAQE